MGNMEGTADHNSCCTHRSTVIPKFPIKMVNRTALSLEGGDMQRSRTKLTKGIKFDFRGSGDTCGSLYNYYVIRT